MDSSGSYLTLQHLERSVDNVYDDDDDGDSDNVNDTTDTDDGELK